MLEIDLEKICFVIVKAREFHAKVPALELGSGSNPSDEGVRRVLEDYADDATYEELRAYLASLNRDELANLVALMWIGRGVFEIGDWKAALAEAHRAENEHSPDYLIGTPLLSDYLEEALSQLGLSCEGYY